MAEIMKKEVDVKESEITSTVEDTCFVNIPEDDIKQENTEIQEYLKKMNCLTRKSGSYLEISTLNQTRIECCCKSVENSQKLAQEPETSKNELSIEEASINERGNLNQELAWDESLEMQDEKQRKEEDVTVFGYCSTCNTQTNIYCSTCFLNIKPKSNNQRQVNNDSHLESADECTACSALRIKKCEKCSKLCEVCNNVSLEDKYSTCSPCNNCTRNKNQGGRFTLSKILSAIISLIIGTSTRRSRKRYDKLAQTEERTSVSDVTCSTDIEQEQYNLQFNQYKDWEWDDEDLTCNVCDRAFLNPNLLHRHQVKHRHWGCSTCETLFNSVMELEHHKESLDHWSEDEWEEEDEDGGWEDEIQILETCFGVTEEDLLLSYAQ